MTHDNITRRRLLQLTGTTAAAGLAGCGGGGGDDSGDGTATDTPTATETATATPTATPTETASGTVSADETVELQSLAFEPTRVEVDPGTSVGWVNRESTSHDVTSAQFHDAAASWDFSADLPSEGSTATHTFESEGIYEYECTIHGQDSMCGAVLVGDVSLEDDLPCEGYSGPRLNLGAVHR